MKKYLQVFFLLLPMPLFAQYKERSADGEITNTSVFDNAKSISLGVGTTGFSIEGKLALNKHFNARLGGSFLPVSYHGPLTLDGVKTNATADASLGKINLLAEYKPFSTSRFRIVGGAAYVFSASPNIVLKPTESYKIGQTKLTPTDLGQMNIRVNWQGVAPYLGMGFFRDFPKSKFNVNMDLGAYFLPKPTSTWSGTNLLSDNQSNDAVLDNNLSGYRWYPELKISFNYKFSKPVAGK